MEILAKAGHRDGDEGQVNESVRTVELFSLSQCANDYNFSCCHEMFIECILKHCAVPGNIHTPFTEEVKLQFPGSWGRLCKTKKIKKNKKSV